MLKINASYGLKEGRPGYGSESALCSVEMEVSDNVTADDLRQKIHSAFCIVREQCKEELASGENGNGKPKLEVHDRRRDAGATSPNSPAKASNRQIKFITDLANRQGMALSDLNGRIRERFGLDGIYDLDKKQASTVVDLLKGFEKKAA